MHLMYTLDDNGKRKYTLKKVQDGQVTKSAHPARFSPDDKFSRHRITLKKRFGLLYTGKKDASGSNLKSNARSDVILLKSDTTNQKKETADKAEDTKKQVVKLKDMEEKGGTNATDRRKCVLLKTPGETACLKTQARHVRLENSGYSEAKVRVENEADDVGVCVLYPGVEASVRVQQPLCATLYASLASRL